MNRIRLVLILGGAILLAAGLQLLLYGLYITFETVSNVTFVLGVILFGPSLIAVTGAYEVMYGFRYAMRTLFDWNYQKKVKNIGEYYESKELKEENKSTVYKEILIVSIILIIVGIVTGGFFL